MPFTPMDQGYKMVADRHAQFVLDNPNGVVMNQVASFSYDAATQQGMILMQSRVWKKREDADAGKLPDGVGHASMPIPGPTSFTRNSEAENAETSALGRALAMIGYHAKETMASEDEIQAKGGSSAPAPTRRGAAPKVVAPPDPEKVSAADRAMLMNWGKKVFGNRDAFLTFLDSQFDIKSGKDIRPDQLGDIKKAIAIHGAAAGQAIPEGVEFDA